MWFIPECTQATSQTRPRFLQEEKRDKDLGFALACEDRANGHSHLCLPQTRNSHRIRVPILDLHISMIVKGFWGRA